MKKETKAAKTPTVLEPLIKQIRKNDKCCIIGFAPSWSLAPFNVEGIDFWGLNELYVYLNMHKITQKFNAWFEIHDIKNSPSKQAPKHQEFLKTCGIPLITQKHWNDYPTSIAYPRAEIKKMVNEHFILDKDHTGFSDYSNQISWMIAMAIYLGYKEIMVYGVDMAQTTEYAFQRASCQFFLGYAAGKGIKVRVPKTCELLKAGRDYGFESDNTGRFDAKKRIEGHSNALNQVRMRQAEIQYYHDKLKAETEKKIIILEAQISEAEKEITRINTGNNANISVSEFLKSMPTNVNEIFSKRDSILKKTEQLIEINKKDIEEINKTIQQLKKKKDRIEKDSAVNHIILDDEYEANKSGSHELKGNIKAHEHNLNNNLV